MATKERKSLEPWQIEDAGRLRRLWEEFHTRTKMSQSQFGAKFDIGTQGAVWQYLQGERALNLRAAIRFAKGLGVFVSDISPTLAAELPDALQSPLQGLEQLARDLPDDSGQEVLDFIRYKFERADGLIASDKAASYLQWIDRITEDLKRRKYTDKKG